MTENWPRKRWIVYKCEDTRLIVKNDQDDRNAKEVLTELFQPFCIVQCLDYSSGKLIDTMQLDEAFEIEDKQ